MHVVGRAVIDFADIDVSIKMSFDIHIDTEKTHIDIEKWYMYIVSVGLDSEKRLFRKKRQKDAKRGKKRHFTNK